MILDADIDALLEAAAGERHDPSSALLARILIDAEHVQTGFTKARHQRISWIARLRNMLPRPEMVFPIAGLAVPALAFLLIGLPSPDRGSEDLFDDYAQALIQGIEVDEIAEATPDNYEDNPSLNAWLAGWNTDLILNE